MRHDVARTRTGHVAGGERACGRRGRDALVVANTSEQDTRMLVYRLSASGQRRYERAHALWQDAQAEFEQHLKRDRAKALRAELFALTKSAA